MNTNELNKFLNSSSTYVRELPMLKELVDNIVKESKDFTADKVNARQKSDK